MWERKSAEAFLNRLNNDLQSGHTPASSFCHQQTPQEPNQPSDGRITSPISLQRLLGNLYDWHALTNTQTSPSPAQKCNLWSYKQIVMCIWHKMS
ncbi:hypothetical protein M758_1G117300 [Ceratodon purpureus]|nr:hypothetical protein M758_1G117300 [Ceratodon purpureus]